jgi:hypothetical protein
LPGATIGRLKKSFFNLYRNVMQPLVRSVGSILIVPDIRFKFSYSVFGGSKLTRKLVSNVQSAFAVFFRDGSRLLKHAQKGISSTVQKIAIVRRRDDFF